MNSKKILSLIFLSLTLAFFLVACQKPPIDDPNTHVDPEDEDQSPIVMKVTGETIYVSPDGKMGNQGTKESPQDLFSAIQTLTAGDTMILLDGVYPLSARIRIPEGQNGNYSSYITVKAEHANQVEIDFSLMSFNGNNRGIQLDADYWYFYGINIKGAGDNGMYIGGSYNIIEMCMFYQNHDTGLQLGRSDGSYTNIKDWPHNNLIKNCTSFDNYDDETYGENADGFAAKLTTGEGNVFDGCIAYRNADDGWDMYAKSDSGNVGVTIIKNCLSFENGMTLTPHLQDYRDPTSAMVYTTRDGDGIGFKLGGSVMEGSVIIENCMSFGNRLHGFSDNSNPGVLSMYNCTSFNNSVICNPDGTVGLSDGLSDNFDMARKNTKGTNSDSYNNYYGLLSYSTNMTNSGIVYTNADSFKGACGYSVFLRYSPITHSPKYYQFTSFMDANSYESDKAGTEREDLTDAIFASVSHNWDTSGNLHQALRNEDGSINTGDMLDIVDSEYLAFCEGKQIGADLNKTRWEDYSHFEFTVPEIDQTTENKVRVIGAYDVLKVMCNPVAVFQNIKLLTLCNECDITWKSSDETVIKIGTEETVSFSNLSYVTASIFRNREKAVDVTLTATISYGGASMEKEFVLHVMQDLPAIGNIIGLQEKYIIDQYAAWENPDVTVTNYASLAGLLLDEGLDYQITYSYKYATSKNDQFYDVSDVYTSVPGVYEVTYTVTSIINPQDKVATSFFVYVSSNTAKIDIDESRGGISFNVSSSGVDIKANLSSTSGNMYVYITTEALATASKIKTSGVIYPVNDEFIDVMVENDNTSSYYIFVVFVNKANTYTSSIYSAKIDLKNISTCEEFYAMVTGKTSPTTIYNITGDIDFTNYTWVESQTTETFGGYLNGNHHTISNITIHGTTPKNVNIFYKVSGGTITNLNFDHITLTGDDAVSTKVAIVGQMANGYLNNIQLTNITAYGYQGVAGMVGQLTGGTNYIQQVSLVNDEHSTIVASGKYCGGIVGNLQKDTSEEKVELYVNNCFVNAVIGGTLDTGGYSGGIVGRYKNDFANCLLAIDHCVVYGRIMTGKNYAGGITGGCDYGFGKTIISHCLSQIVLYYAGTTIDGVNAVSVKNGSPIMGRQTIGSGTYEFYNNYGSFNDYNMGISDGDDLDFKLSRRYFWDTSLDLNLENIWSLDETTKTVSLKH